MRPSPWPSDSASVLSLARRYASLLVGHALARRSALLAAAVALALAAFYYACQALLGEAELGSVVKQKPA